MSTAVTEEDHVQDEWYEEAKGMTVETLPGFVRKLTEDYQHDYGTVCHAVAAAALAAGHAVDHSPTGGITGFQAGAIMWEFITHWNHIEGRPLRLMDYEEMLYPQYEHKFEKTISAETWDWLQEEARKHIADINDHPTVTDEEGNEIPRSHGDVYRHWERIAAGQVPFGYTVRED